jgi:hypothetical protein
MTMLQTCNKRQVATDLVWRKQQKIKNISRRFIMFIPTIAHSSIQSYSMPPTSFFFRPTSGRESTKKNTTLAVSEICYCRGKKRRYNCTKMVKNYDIISHCCVFYQYLPEDGRRRPKHVGGLLYDISYILHLFFNCWNKHCNIISLHGIWIILNYHKLWNWTTAVKN